MLKIIPSQKYISTNDVRRFKREAKRLTRKAKSVSTPKSLIHAHALDRYAQSSGYARWNDLMRVHNSFHKGCVIAIVQYSLSEDRERAALIQHGFEPATDLHSCATDHLLQQPHEMCLKYQHLRCDSDYSEHGLDRQRRDFWDANPLYKAQLFSMPAASCQHMDAEGVLALIGKVSAALSAKYPDEFLFVPRPDYIWLKGVRTDYGTGGVSHLPPELDYTQEELDDMEYATALEATAGW